MSTTNLGLELIDEHQQQKAAAANAALLGLENAITETATVSVEDGANAVGSADYRGSVHLLLAAGSPGPSAAFDVSLPALKGFKVITNTTAYDATVACAGAAPGAAEATVSAGATAIVYNDTSGVVAVSASGAGSAFTDLADVPASYAGAGGKLLAVNAGATGVEFKAARELPLEINAQTGTTYTLVLADAGKLVTLNNAAAITLYVPEAASVDFPVGTQILLAQLDAQVTVAGGAVGVTITTPETMKLRKAGAQASLIKIGADAWLLEGNLEAA